MRAHQGFDVPMHETFLMHVLQSPGDLGDNGRGFRLWKRRSYILLEIAIFKEFHSNVQVILVVEPAEESDKMLFILRRLAEGRPTCAPLACTNLEDPVVGKRGKSFEFPAGHLEEFRLLLAKLLHCPDCILWRLRHAAFFPNGTGGAIS